MMAAFKRWFGRRDVVLFSRHIDAHERVQTVPGYTFSRLQAADLRECALAKERGRLPKFEKRLADGYRCAGFRDRNGHVVSYIWMARGDIGPHDVAIWRDIRVQVQPGDVFFWDCRTAPEHEGRGLYRTGLRLAALELARSGAKRGFIETEPHNLASQGGIVAAGFARMAEISLLACPNLRLMRRSGGRWRRIRGELRLGGDIA